MPPSGNKLPTQDYKYEVIVNNVGTVYCGGSKPEAQRVFQEYICALYEHAAGRAEWPVTIIETNLSTHSSDTTKVDLSRARPTGYVRQVHDKLLALLHTKYSTYHRFFSGMRLTDFISLDLLVHDIALYEQCGTTPEDAALEIVECHPMFWGCEF